MDKLTHPIDDLDSENEELLELVMKAANVGDWNWQIETEGLTFNHRWAEIIG
ncbi:MAG: hypothetical protein ACI843_002928, partial [Psychrobacter glaciei]